MVEGPAFEDLFSKFRETYTWSSQPHREERLYSDEQASDFAKLLVQSLLILHGGSLVGLPAIFQLMKVDVGAHKYAVIVAALFVAFGLLATFFAGICGFFAMANRADAFAQLLEAGLARSWATVHRIFDQPELASKGDKHANELDEKAKPFFGWYDRWRTMGIVSIIASLACYVVVAGISLFIIA